MTFLNLNIEKFFIYLCQYYFQGKLYSIVDNRKFNRIFLRLEYGPSSRIYKSVYMNYDIGTVKLFNLKVEYQCTKKNKYFFG